ncbi:MAG: hypothetical protein RL344_199 [Pseudomonadota bacterium]|jgi:hypothetical protein
MKKSYLFLQHKQLFKFILNVLIIGMSSVVYAKDINVIKKQFPKNQFKRIIELDYFTKAPLTIYQNAVENSGEELSPKEKFELNKKAENYEKEALANAGQYLALVCTSKTSCSIRANQVFTRKEKVWAGYAANSTYPDGTDDGVVAWVKKPIKGTVFFIKSNLPSVKKDHPIKTWYANLDALHTREKEFNPHDYPTNTTEEAEAEQSRKKKYIQTISLDHGNQLTVIGKTKENAKDNDGSFTRINWFVKVNGIEKKLTFMKEPILELKDMADIPSYLLWVGDLDGDNQPDLIVNNDGGWGEIEYKLFLSTDIKPNKPWKPAAVFGWSSGSPRC